MFDLSKEFKVLNWRLVFVCVCGYLSIVAVAAAVAVAAVGGVDDDAD